MSHPNPRARERGGVSNIRIGPRSGLCVSTRMTVGGCRAVEPVNGIAAAIVAYD